MIFFFSFLSCGTRSDDYVVIDTGSDYDFHTIEIHDGVLYATGGDVWTSSSLSQSINGDSWTTDSLSNKSIFDLHSDGNSLYAVGVDGYIFKGDPDLSFTRTKHWDMLRGFANSEIGHVAVGGKDFNKGWIYKVNSDLSIDTTYILDNEMSDVICDSFGNCIAVGFGLIMTSSDSGYTWIPSSETGDFFNSIDYNSAGIPFAIGYSGTLMTSDDDGKTWDKFKDGHSPLGDNVPFRSIKFFGMQGFIVGDNGTVWYSEDDGSSWSDMSINTEDDLFDFVFHNDQLVIVSEVGKVYLKKV